MVSIEISYTGDLHCEATHGPSGSVIQTDAPKDNQGKGEAFSPTDLLATALATCILTTMGIMARRLEVDMTGATARVDKIMSSEGPRRVAALPLVISMPAGISELNRTKLEAAAQTCPVAKSLHPDVKKTLTFEWA
ncbi:OsmC family peroxiredoxin [bacterium]|nr:MAG: OsmC family peroxiredoxin [bacterium]